MGPEGNLSSIRILEAGMQVHEVFTNPLYSRMAITYGDEVKANYKLFSTITGKTLLQGPSYPRRELLPILKFGRNDELVMLKDGYKFETINALTGTHQETVLLKFQPPLPNIGSRIDAFAIDGPYPSIHIRVDNGRKGVQASRKLLSDESLTLSQRSIGVVMSAHRAPKMEYFMGGSQLMVFIKEHDIPAGYCFDSELNLITVVTLSEPLPMPSLFHFYHRDLGLTIIESNELGVYSAVSCHDHNTSVAYVEFTFMALGDHGKTERKLQGRYLVEKPAESTDNRNPICAVTFDHIFVLDACLLSALDTRSGGMGKAEFTPRAVLQSAEDTVLSSAIAGFTVMWDAISVLKADGTFFRFRKFTDYSTTGDVAHHFL